MKGGPLWLGFGNLRDEVVDKLIDLRKKYSDFVINSEKNYL
jgi:Fe-coproporphyrin III synthase